MQLEDEKQTNRAAVLWFANEMEKKLCNNDYKGGWSYPVSLQFLSKRLTEERKELYDAIKSGNKEEIISECADIANFAMMIADRFANDFGH